MKPKKFPFYMYHKDYEEPRRVDHQSEIAPLESQGWVTHRIWREFPKMVNGIIVKTPAEEKLLRDAEAAKPKVEVKKTILTPGGTPIHTERPATKTQVQVPASPEAEGDPKFEIINSEGEVIPDLQFASWKDAQAKQKELNQNSPGHKARKIAEE